MSGASRQAPVGRSFNTKHSSDDGNKKPVKFQIAASKRLSLVQYSDDDSAESTSGGLLENENKHDIKNPKIGSSEKSTSHQCKYSRKDVHEKPVRSDQTEAEPCYYHTDTSKSRKSRSNDQHFSSKKTSEENHVLRRQEEHNRSSSRHAQDESNVEYVEDYGQSQKNRRFVDNSCSSDRVEIISSKKYTSSEKNTKIPDETYKKFHDSKDSTIGHNSRKHKKDRHISHDKQTDKEYERSIKKLDRSSDSSKTCIISPVETKYYSDKSEKHRREKVDQELKCIANERNQSDEASKNCKQSSTSELRNVDGERNRSANMTKAASSTRSDSDKWKTNIADSPNTSTLIESQCDQRRHNQTDTSKASTFARDSADFADQQRHHHGDTSKKSILTRDSSDFADQQRHHRTDTAKKIPLTRNSADIANAQKHDHTDTSKASTSTRPQSDQQRHHRADTSNTSTSARDSSNQQKHHHADTSKTSTRDLSDQLRHHHADTLKAGISIEDSSESKRRSCADTTKSVIPEKKLATVAQSHHDNTHQLDTTKTSGGLSNQRPSAISSDPSRPIAAQSNQQKCHASKSTKSTSLTNAQTDHQRHDQKDGRNKKTKQSESQSNVVCKEKPRRKSSSGSVENSSSSSSSGSSSSSDDDTSSSGSSSSTSDSSSSDDGQSYTQRMRKKSHHSVKSLKNAKWVEIRKPVQEIVAVHERRVDKIGNSVTEERQEGGSFCKPVVNSPLMEKSGRTTNNSVERTDSSMTYSTESENKVSCERDDTNHCTSDETFSRDNLIRPDRGRVLSSSSKTDHINEFTRTGLAPNKVDVMSTSYDQSSDRISNFLTRDQKPLVSGKHVLAVSCKRTASDVYSPSAPTGWDTDDKPGNAPGWSSDSDIEHPVLPESSIAPPQLSISQTAMSDLNHKIFENANISLDCSHQIAPGASLDSNRFENAAVMSRSSVCTSPTTSCEQATLNVSNNERKPCRSESQLSGACVDKIEDSFASRNTIQADIMSGKKGDKNLDADESSQNRTNSSADKNVTPTTTSCREVGVSKSADNIPLSTHINVSSRKLDKSDAPLSRVEQLGLEVSSSGKLDQSDQHICQNKSSISRAQSKLELESHTSRKRKDYIYHSEFREREHRRGRRSDGSRSPSYDGSSYQSRRGGRSSRRSTSRDRQSSRKRLSSRSPNRQLGDNPTKRHGRRNKKQEQKTKSDSSDSDDVVIVEDYIVSAQNPLNSKKVVDSSSKNNVLPGNVDLDNIPLPVIPDSIPLPVLSDGDSLPSKPMLSVHMPVKMSDVMLSNRFDGTDQSNATVLPAACAESTLPSATKRIQGTDCLESVDMDLDDSDDCLRSVDMELNNRVDCSANVGMVTDNVNHTIDHRTIDAQIQIAGRSRMSSAGEDTAVSSLLSSDQHVNSLNQPVIYSRAGNDIRVSEKLLEPTQSQVADISSTTVESPLPAEETLPVDRSVIKPPSKIVLSLGDSRKTGAADNQNTNTMWKRKLAINIVKPVKFNLSASVSHNSLDEDDESDQSPEVKHFDRTAMTPVSDTCYKQQEQRYAPVVVGENEKTSKFAPVAHGTEGSQKDNFSHSRFDKHMSVTNSAVSNSDVSSNSKVTSLSASGEFFGIDTLVRPIVEKNQPIVAAKQSLQKDEIKRVPLSCHVELVSTSQSKEMAVQSPQTVLDSSNLTLCMLNSVRDSNTKPLTCDTTRSATTDSVKSISKDGRTVHDDSSQRGKFFEDLSMSKQQSSKPTNSATKGNKTQDCDQRQSSSSRRKSRSRDRLERHASKSDNQNSKDRRNSRDSRSRSVSKRKSRERGSCSPSKRCSRDRYSRSPPTRKRRRSSSLFRQSTSPSRGSRQSASSSRKKSEAETCSSSKDRRRRSSSTKNERYEDKNDLALRSINSKSHRQSNTRLDESKVAMSSNSRISRDEQKQPVVPKKRRFSSIERDEHKTCDKLSMQSEHRKLLPDASMLSNDASGRFAHRDDYRTSDKSFAPHSKSSEVDRQNLGNLKKDADFRESKMGGDANVKTKSLCSGETIIARVENKSTGCKATKLSEHPSSPSRYAYGKMSAEANRKLSISPDRKGIISRTSELSDKRFACSPSVKQGMSHDRKLSPSLNKPRSYSREKDQLNSFRDQKTRSTVSQNVGRRSRSNDRRMSGAQLKRSVSKDRLQLATSRSPAYNRRSGSYDRRSRSIDGSVRRELSNERQQRQSSIYGQGDVFYRREDKDNFSSSADKHKLGRVVEYTSTLCSPGNRRHEVYDDSYLESSIKQLSPCRGGHQSRRYRSPDYDHRQHHHSGSREDRHTDYGNIKKSVELHNSSSLDDLFAKKTSSARHDSHSLRKISPEHISIPESSMKRKAYAREANSPEDSHRVKCQNIHISEFYSDRSAAPMRSARKSPVIDLSQSRGGTPEHINSFKSQRKCSLTEGGRSPDYGNRYEPQVLHHMQSYGGESSLRPQSKSHGDKSQDYGDILNSPVSSNVRSWEDKSPNYGGRMISPVRRHSRSQRDKSPNHGDRVVSPVRRHSKSREGKSPDYGARPLSPGLRHSRSREGKLPDYGARVISPARRRSPPRRGKSPDYGGRAMSPGRRHSPSREGKSPNYGGRTMSPVRRLSRSREGNSPNYGGRTISPMRSHSRSREGKSPDYRSKVISRRGVRQHSLSQEDRSPDYSGRDKSPVRRHSPSLRGKSPDYGGRAVSSVRCHSRSRKGKSPDYGGKDMSPVRLYSQSGRGKSPGYGRRAMSPVRHHSRLSENKSPNRDCRSKSPVTRHSHSSGNIIVGKSPNRSFKVMSPVKHFSQSMENKLSSRDSRLKSPIHQKSWGDKSLSQGGRVQSPSPVKHQAQKGIDKSPQNKAKGKSPLRHQSRFGDESHDAGKRSALPNRRRSTSSNMDLSNSPPDPYCGLDVSPSMSITSLPDQDIVVNELMDQPVDVRLHSGHLDTAGTYCSTIQGHSSHVALYSDFAPPVIPQHQGTYGPTVPFGTFPMAANHHGYQGVGHSVGLNTSWYQTPGSVLPPSAEQMSTVHSKPNFSSYSHAWNEPYSSDMMMMPGGTPVQPGLFSQAVNQHSTNQYMVPPANQFVAPSVNQVNPPVAGQGLAAGCWPAQTGPSAASIYQLSQNSYQLPPNASMQPVVLQPATNAAKSSDKGTPVPIVSCSTSVEVPPKKAPSPQWMPLFDRHRDNFRSSYDSRSLRKSSSDSNDALVKTGAVVSQKIESGKNSEIETCCSKPDLSTQLADELVGLEDPGCCCLWEAVPEVVFDVKSNLVGSIAVVAEDRSARSKTKKRPGRHSENASGTSAMSSRRRSSRFKSNEDVNKEEYEKIELKTEDETDSSAGFIGNCDTYSSNDDGVEGSKHLCGDVSKLFKPEKVKSRWRRWSELETDGTVPPPPPPPPLSALNDDNESIGKTREDKSEDLKDENEKRPYFDEILDNIFLSSRDTKKARKEARHMICDCTPPSTEELARGIQACGDDCLNRMLMIECGSRCPCGDLCTNRLFQRHQYSQVKCFKTDYKGWGLQADDDLPPGKFIMEYVGEVLDPREFKSRIKRYARENYEHHYFMALNADEVIDATKRGNVSRFVNHCCDPNSETQKWTVNGELRIGFFTIKPVKAGEELTFDYQFETYGQEATKCYCGSSNCRGTIDVGRRSPFKKRSSKSSTKVKDLKKLPGMFSDIFLEEEIEKMSSMGGLRRKDDVLELNRLMLRAESTDHRISLLKALQDTKEPACLRLFLDYHGLALLWSWMVDVPTNDFSFKSRVLHTLKILPISNKTVLRDSRILAVVEKWAHQLSTESITALTTEHKGHSTDVAKPTDACIAESTVADNQVTGDCELEDEKSHDRTTISQSSEHVSTLDLAPSMQKADITEQAASTESVNKVTLVSEEVSNEDTKDAENGLSQVIGDSTLDLPLPSSGLVPHKKRHLLMAVETPSSSDGELAKTEETTSQDGEDGANVMTLTDNTSICMSHDDDMTSVTEDEMNDRHAVTAVNDLARNLLSNWANLKEAYKIPKLFVEERKRTEQELDRRCEEHQSRKDSVLSWNRVAQRRLTDDSPDIKRRRRDERSKTTDSDEIKTPRMRNIKPIASTSPAIKSVQSTPSTMSKEERRQQFEAQVKAHDELMQQKNDLQLQQQQQPDSTYTDVFAGTPSGVSFNYADSTQYPVDVSVGAYPTDPSLSMSAGAYGSDLTMSLQLPVGSYGQDVAMSGTMGSIGTYLQDMTLSAPVTADQAANLSAITYCSQPDMSYYDTQASYQQLTQSAPSLLACDQMHQMPSATATHNYAQTSSVPHDSYSLVVDTLGQAQQYSTQTGMYYTVQGTTVLVQQPLYTPSAPQIVHIAASRPPPVVSRDPRDPPPPPPSPPPKHKAVRLPPNWKTAKDANGKVYYYHSVTRQTQWDAPAWDANSVDEDDEDYMDLGTPTNDGTRPSSQRRFTTTTAAADTSSEVAKRLKDNFRNQIAKHIVACLGPYRRPDCEQGRINTTEEFKLLARKLSYAVMSKELKHCRHLEDLEVNENVKGKARSYVVKYMSRFPGMYRASNYSP